MWSQFLLISVSLFSTLVIYRRFKGLRYPTVFAYIAVLLIAGGMLNSFLNEPLPVITTQVILLAALLTGLVFLLVSIRLMKPLFVRNSMIYAFIPYLVLPVYILLDSESLQLLIDATLQGTAIIVLLIIITGYFKTISNSWILFVGLLCFTVAYLTHWFLGGPNDISRIIVNCSVTIGVISLCLKFPMLIKQNEKN